MMTLDQMIEVLTAYKAGKKIEVKGHGGVKWHKTSMSAWDFVECDYRAKPEPKVIWVNEYSDLHFAYCSEKEAKDKDRGAIRTAVRYVECPEGDAS